MRGEGGLFPLSGEGYVLLCSLIAKWPFLDGSKKYPVLLRREFGRERLIFIAETSPRPLRKAKLRENSLYFPGYQGIWL
jgi:hypothetical protein